MKKSMITRMSCVLALAVGLAVGCDDGEAETDSGVVADTGVDPGDSGTGDDDSGVDTDSGVDPGDSGVDPGDSGVADSGMGGGAAHCEATDLILEEIDPGTSITIFNPTGSAIDTSSGYVLCQRPSYPALASLEAGVTIAAGDRHTFPWPSAFGDTDAGGEVALYSSGAFGSAAAQIDFVCWGSGHSPSRKSVAEMDGDWSGDCAGAITGDSLRRIADTAGAGAADYDPTGATAALTCP